MKISPSHRTSGAALVLILLAILALSSLVVLFFSLAANDRTNTGAYAQGMKADELASGGLEFVIEKIREEIADPTRSTASESVPPGKGPTVYTPIEPEYILPDATVTVSATAPSNLIKISSATLPISNLTSGTTVASNASTATPSKNGRAITADRWSKPQLETFGSGTGAPIPDWIYMSRTGPIANPTLADAANSESAAFVTGRIAFAVYDVGGLIDLNVAGYPLGFPAGEAGKKGSPAYVRLQSLGIPDTAIEKILSFRNPKSATDTASYLSYTQDSDAHEGFTKTVAGDNRFLSRQELVRFAEQNGFASQLPLLTIFTREKNAPSYAPDSSVPPTTAPPSINPNLATARHTASGRLLFEQRFPLSKIALLAELRANPSSAELAEAVKMAFGLTYDSGTRQFSYHGPESSTRTEIKTLDQIGAEADYRVPDFFETLKSVIYAGSLGQSAGTTATTPDQDDADSQIIRIGSSIIDQYDTDFIPTAVYFGASSAIPLWGVENLPYVNKIQVIAQKPGDGPLYNAEGKSNQNGTAGSDGKYYFRWAVELWNPHIPIYPVTSTPGPNIKIAMGPNGSLARVDMCPNAIADITAAGKVIGDPKAVNSAEFSNEINVASGHGRKPSVGPSSYTLFRYFCDPRQVYFGAVNTAGMDPLPGYSYGSAVLQILGNLYVELSVRDPSDGFLYPYFRTWTLPGGSLKLKSNSGSSAINGSAAYMVSDPRTNRMGLFDASWWYDASNSNGPPSYDDGTSVGARTGWPIRVLPSVLPNASVPSSGAISASEGYAGSSIYPGLLYENTENATKFTDSDGIARRADGGFEPGAAAKVPMTPVISHSYIPPYPGDAPSAGPNLSRPKILDRPFRNVAELGYAFRDQSWKSLNFSGTDSGDSGLLDAFSLDDQKVYAGKVNINTPYREVWESILAESIRQEDSWGITRIDTAAASVLAQTITNYLSSSVNSPMANIADFVTKLSTTSILHESGFEGSEKRAIKAQRESAIRSISNATQSRTWNIMVDLVAQSGRFPKNATTLDNFIVEGERRYWLHLAIDRYTGEIIDEQIEAITE